MKIYVEEGDQLLLLQSKSNLRSLFLLSHVHLILKSFSLSVLFVILLLPLLAQYFTFTLKEIILGFCFLLIVRLCSAVLKHNIYLKFQGIKLYITLSCLAILLFWWTYLYFAYSFSSDIIQLVQLTVSLLVYMYYSCVSISKSRLSATIFELNIRNESKALQFLLSRSAYIGAPEFIYTKSKRAKNEYLIIGKNYSFFKQNSQVNGMTELVIKSLIRNNSWSMMYFQIIGVGFIQLWLVPELWIKVILFIIFIGLLYKFANVFWGRVFDHSFFKLFPWLKFKYSSEKWTYVVISPGVVLLSSFLGYITYSLLGLVIALALGILIMHIYIKILPSLVSKFVVFTRSRL